MAKGWQLPERIRIRRFREKIILTDACWLWTGFLSPTGYGRYKWADRKNYLAHRLFWMLFIGPIPQGLKVCHTCDNRRCVKPSHLFLGTQQDNIQDMVAKGRNRAGKRKQQTKEST